MSATKMKMERLIPLSKLNSEAQLWAHWLTEHPSGESTLPLAFRATEGLASIMNSGHRSPQKSLPLPYAQQLIEDLDSLIDDPDERKLLTHSILSLASGKGRAVVTGQQPGFAGGPLYSLYKIATTVALARLLTKRGQATVPVYWMGDDDDDWQELLDPLLWDGDKGELTASDLQPDSQRNRQSMIGDVPCFPLEEKTRQWLDSYSPDNSLSQQFAQIYQKAAAQDDNLSSLTEKLLRCVFHGTGLVIVRGNDPRLHAQSGIFYEKALSLLPDLAKLTEQQGRLMAKEFGVETLSPNSLNRPLYITEGSVRIPWQEAEVPADSSALRCGVLLRSMLQDWLLQPLAVVVGPGELSYLSQLVPAYERMGIKRSPLLPRLFGWIYPSGFPQASLEKFTIGRPLDPQECQDLALKAGAAGQEVLEQLLMQELNLDSARARDLAAGRTRRWVKGVQAMLKNESRKEFEKMRPTQPEWVFPQGKRQERKLAWTTVAATWGKPLIKAVLDGCETHIQDGLLGRWHEFGLSVPLPEEDKRKVLVHE